MLEYIWNFMLTSSTTSIYMIVLFLLSIIGVYYLSRKKNTHGGYNFDKQYNYGFLGKKLSVVVMFVLLAGFGGMSLFNLNNTSIDNRSSAGVSSEVIILNVSDLGSQYQIRANLLVKGEDFGVVTGYTWYIDNILQGNNSNIQYVPKSSKMIKVIYGDTIKLLEL